MDTSIEFISMCQDARDIQSLKKHTTKISGGDWLYNTTTKSVEFGSFSVRNNVRFLSKEYIWLPRQDQYQELIENNQRDLLHNFNNYFENNYMNGIRWDTFEKWWLCYTMLILYNKVWLIESWIDENNNR